MADDTFFQAHIKCFIIKLYFGVNNRILKLEMNRNQGQKNNKKLSMQILECKTVTSTHDSKRQSPRKLEGIWY